MIPIGTKLIPKIAKIYQIMPIDENWYPNTAKLYQLATNLHQLGIGIACKCKNSIALFGTNSTSR